MFTQNPGVFEAQQQTIKELTSKCESLEKDLFLANLRHRTEKTTLLQHLTAIEENYQKYAYFYTKYLEEQVSHQEAQSKAKKENERQQKQLEALVGLVLDVMAKLH